MMEATIAALMEDRRSLKVKMWML
jgi:hypothetical protein